jgi:hypothetical protein
MTTYNKIKITIRPGWTRAMMRERVRRYVPDRGCVGVNPETGDPVCMYQREGFRCALGAMMSDQANALCAGSLKNIVNMVGESVYSEEQQARFLGPFLTPGDASSFQRTHDDAAFEGRPDIPGLLCEWIDNNILEHSECS